MIGKRERQTSNVKFFLSRNVNDNQVRDTLHTLILTIKYFTFDVSRLTKSKHHTMPVRWIHKKFDELTLHELYDILQLRSEVFVVEQQCAFLDADNKDKDSYHVMGWKDHMLAAYTRLLPPKIVYEEASIGRVVTSPNARNKGIGKELMQYSISVCYSVFGKIPIKIGAQLYLKNFYESFGFRQDSAIYVEDGIDHIEMILAGLQLGKTKYYNA